MTSTLTTKRVFTVLIDGEWLETKETFPIENPATREIIAEVPRCSREDMDHAVRAARIAFESGKWPKMTSSDRGRLLFKIAQLIRENADKLAELETRSTGRPIRETRNIDVVLAADCFEYYAGLADKIQGETVPTTGNAFHYTLREPLGVIGLVLPWNFPLLMLAWKLAPALAAGNTVVLKPSAYTPLTALRLGELMVEAGLPSGVVNIVTSPGTEIEEHLSKHPGVDKVVFTGETATGRLVMETAAKTTKAVSLALGGKSSSMVFADADMERAVEGSLFALYFNQGQLCSTGSRLFVQESIYESFVKKFVDRVKSIRVGDPLKEDSQLGALISKEQVEAVLKMIEKGQSEGATLLAGGHPVKNLQGYFIEPTVFGDVKNTMAIAKEEILGPVVSIITFKDEADVIRKANDTLNGLTSTIWTKNLDRAHRIAREVKAGTVWVNCCNRLPNEAPFYDAGQPGAGRDLGLQAVSLYTQVKNIVIDLSDKASG